MKHAEIVIGLNIWGENVWAKFARLYSTIGTRPIIVLNNRLRTTLGRAWLEDGKVDLCTRLYEKYEHDFLYEVIPHEYAHFVAYRVYGDAGHGPSWKSVMRNYGLEPRRFYTFGE